MLCFHDFDIEEVRVPESVEIIGCYAFEGCKNLKKVIFAKNSQLREIGIDAFRGCSSLKRISLPESIEEIPQGCFYKSGLEEIVIPRNVKKISSGNSYSSAFSNCENLRSVVFEQGSELTEISKYTFYECKSLKNICLPDKLRKIGKYAFSETGLTDV